MSRPSDRSAPTADRSEHVDVAGTSLLEFLEGAAHDDLDVVEARLDGLVVAYDTAPEAAAADPPCSQVAEHVAQLWRDTDIPRQQFVGLLEDAAEHCRLLRDRNTVAQEGGR